MKTAKYSRLHIALSFPILYFFLAFQMELAHAQGQLLDSAALAKEKTYTSLEEALEEPEKVYKLDLSIYAEKDLSDLSLWSDELSKFKNIQELMISIESDKNVLSKIPLFKGLNNLQKLKLENIRLGNFQESEIKSFFDELSSLPRLEELNLSKNNLSSKQLFLRNLKNLKILNLNDNVIQSLTTEFLGLENLKELYCGNNILIKIQGSNVFKNLEILDLSQNPIMQVEKSIGKYPKLRSLILDETPILSLPNEIGELKELETLSLSSCAFLISLPDSITNLRKLKNLTIHLDYDNGISRSGNAKYFSLPLFLDYKSIYNTFKNLKLYNPDLKINNYSSIDSMNIEFLNSFMTRKYGNFSSI
jgi:Leucine-rich repeat (LRR) protein